MLIEDYDIDIFTPPCHPGAERFAARALLLTDISAVLPYLNATLPGAVYNRTGNTLIWKTSGHNIAFRPYEIAASHMEDRAATRAALEAVIELVNRTRERRGEIVPDAAGRQRPAAMALYKLLPGTNCRQCGQASCWQFALKLAACAPLCEPANAAQLAALEALCWPPAGRSRSMRHDSG